MGLKVKPILAQYNEDLKGKSIQQAFDILLAQNWGKVAFSTSLGQEDQVLTDFIFRNNLPISIFTLDTGRLFPETYALINATNARYKRKIEIYFPDYQLIEKLTSEKGLFSFYDNVENRKECCQIRKIEPLKRALQGVAVWVTGLRSGQSQNRAQVPFLQYDAQFDLIKFNPLTNWTLEEVDDYLKTHNVPQNSLHQKGFISIGCQPCTRAIEPGEDIRAGRWWWENSKKECGLHKE